MDALSRESFPRPRIASLLPSATELVCAAGGREDLVGISHECDFPDGLHGLPILTRPRTALPRASGDIDRSVREVLAGALGIYDVDVEALKRAAPNVIVTQDLCEVCAVSLDLVREALAATGLSGVRLVTCHPTRLADVWDDLRRVGEAIGRGARAADEAERLAAAAAALGAETAALGTRPTVLTVEWLDPVMIGGLWMPELVELAGGRALVTRTGEHAPTLPLSELAALDPDVVLIKPCGFDLERGVEELALLPNRLPWSTWSAVRHGRVFLADGNAYFNRPGPRLLESAEILAACVHPQAMLAYRAKHRDALRRVTQELSLAPV